MLTEDDLRDRFLLKFRPQSLKGLAAEALKYDNFLDFEKAFSIEIRHGIYWHLTDNPNFTIDPLRGPRDMSSLADGKPNIGKLMVTSDIRNWTAYMPDRKYVAEIDMSRVDKKDYYSVNRGFGQEFWVENPSKARVIRVIPLANALKISDYRHSKMPFASKEELEVYYNQIRSQFEDFVRNQK